MRRLLAPIILAMITTLMLAPCNETDVDQETGSGKDNNSKELTEYKIGVIYSKTGPNSPLGEPEWNATKLLEEQINAAGGINGIPLKVIMADDESTQEKATLEMNRLVNDENVLVVLGSSGTGESLAMKGIAMQEEVPMISAGASPNITAPVEDSKWVFKTPHSDIHAVERIYMYLGEQGISKIGVIADSNAYGSSGIEQLERLADEYDIDIVSQETYNTQDPDMSAQITKINSAKAEAIVTWGTNPGPAVIAKNTRDLGIDIPIVNSHGVANQSFITLAGEAAEGVVIPTGKLLFPEQISKDDVQFDIITKFYNEYTEEFGGEPTNFGSYGYDNMLLVIAALESGADDHESIRDFLENDVKDWVGTTGIFNFTNEDHNGLSPDSMVMAIVENGEWKLLEE